MKRLLILFSVIILQSSMLTMMAADQFVSFKSEGIKLCQKGESFSICIGEKENIAVRLAAQNLCKDFEKVCG
ncbi:MAG: hypothetical protein KBT39_07740, partial [Bacteroidales bacterium]|nr:hypothetical protein [Bacteroidales bacterium]